MGVDVGGSGGFRAVGGGGGCPRRAVPVLPGRAAIGGNLIGHRAFVVLAEVGGEGSHRAGEGCAVAGGDVGAVAGIAAEAFSRPGVVDFGDFRRGEQAVDEEGFVQIAVVVAEAVVRTDAVGVVVCADVEVAFQTAEIEAVFGRAVGRGDFCAVNIEPMQPVAVHRHNCQMPATVVIP